MDSRVCMNPCCGTTSTSRWMDGWPLRAGDFANLCEACGDAYKKSIFCNTFHENESGWRNCKSCSKRLHCGCIASKFMLELLDGGGVECTNCMKNSSHSPAHCAGQLATSPLSHTAQHLPSRCSSDERRNGRSISQLNDAGEIVSSSLTAKIGSISMKEGYVWQSSRDAQEQSDGLGVSAENIKREQGASVSEARSACFPDMSKIGYSRSLNQNADEHSIIDRETYGSLTSAYLNISLGTSNPGSSVGLNNVPNNTKLASSREQKLQNRIPLLQGQRSRHPLLKPASTSPSTGSQSSKDVAPQIRVARPPGEGRGRNQLLPRYWPRITDQELQQIFGNSNSKIVPLFEKVLSASDAGRIGRLVLPKACAEAYFPPISQPEGLPLTIQDDKGKNWLFQFRFWPNNNSRMYVLEGVTPCIQSMQLQAGDTVTFSRIDPEGKLVMGFRKSTTSSSIPESQVGTTGNGRITSNAYISTTVENGYSGPFHSLKGNSDGCLNNLSEHLNISDADISWRRAEKNGGRSKEEIQSQQFQVQKKKRARNIGCKSKRLIIDKHDAMQLKITWEEAQDLFRPPPSVKPSIIMIEDHEFEEYEEPPVFGKMTLFTSRSSGEHDQWAQCDNCSKWRRVPMDALIPSRWTCADNSWDPKRSSCSALDEVTPNLIEDTKRSFEELHRLKLNRDVKKRRSIGSPKPIPQDMSALDALATVAVLGENGDTTTSTATTTKHPRHRPGCSCIVCIQPPSGKGPKHMPTCTCNVCMTVRRRFKTLMLRRKKRQSEQEAETARKKNSSTKEDGDIEKTPKCSIQIDASANETRQAHTSNSSVHKSVTEAEEVCTLKVVPMENETKGQIDLNCDPVREDDLLAGACTPGISMMTLLQDAALPLETYLKQNGLTSLVGDQQTSSSVPFPGKESETKPDDGQFAPLQEQMAASAEGAHLSVDQMKNDAM